MTVRKTAIAIPNDLLLQVDRAAQERGESRSAYITRLLRLAVKARRDAEITRRLDELFADPEVRQDQTRTLDTMDSVGSSWTEERW